MKDSILKGAGNSRFLKSAVPAGTSWADALAMLQAGTFPIDFNGINAEGFQQVGTPLNKANLLKDATAAQIGLPPSTTPDGMFQALGNTGELHVWRKTVTLSEGKPAVQAGYTLGSATSIDIFKNARPTQSFKCYWNVADSVSVDNDGNVALVSPAERSLYYNQGDTIASLFRGKFAQYSRTESGGLLNDKNIYWIPQDASIGFLNDSGVYRVYLSAQLVSGHPYTPAIPAGTTITYPVSTNPNAYQEGDDAKAAGYVLGSKTETWAISSSVSTATARATLASSVSVGNDGTVSLVSPNTNTPVANETNSQYVSVARDYLRGSFLQRSDGTIWYIPSDANVTSTASGVSEYGAPHNYCFVAEMQPVTGYAAIPAVTTIEYLGKLGDKAMVQMVSYVGTGTYGEDNPCSLMFDFPPKVVMFLVFRTTGGTYANQTQSNGVLTKIPVAILNDSEWTNCFGNRDYVSAKKSNDSKVIYWFSTKSADSQWNNAGSTYYFLGIG